MPFPGRWRWTFPGGTWRLTVPDDDGDPDETMTGVYKRRGAWRQVGDDPPLPNGDTVMEVRFEPDAGGTLLTISQDCSTPEECEGGREGSAMLMDACAEYLANIKQGEKK